MQRKITPFYKIINIALSMILAVSMAFVLPSASMNVYAAHAYAVELPVEVNGVLADKTISTINLSYDNNRYIAIDDIAYVLKDTDFHFSYELSREEIRIDLGGVVGDVAEEDEGTVPDEALICNAKFTDMYVNDEKVMYYTVMTDYDGNKEDECFIAPYDLAMLLDADIQVIDDSKISITTDHNFNVDPTQLEADGFFQNVNAVAVGNASTGEIYYSYQSSVSYAIASTTKLMSYLIISESMNQNGVTLSDMVEISDKAEILSGSDDGVLPMKAGNKISVNDLLYGMLLPSSNECALALAEYTAGSEEEFVKRMNTRAADLGLSSAHFINCNGLPKYTDSTVAAKLQNTLSADDMFKLCSYILSTYPEIKNITSTKEIEIASFDKELKNTNVVLYNMPECTGLKTGTTNRAGACLVTSVEVDTQSGKEDLIVVLLGAENSAERGRVAQMLSRYALAVRNGDADSHGGVSAGGDAAMPTTAEGFISMITRAARNRALSAN